MPRKAGPQPYQVDTRGRVALPPEAKAALGVDVGDFVAFEIDGKTVRVRKVTLRVE